MFESVPGGSRYEHILNKRGSSWLGCSSAAWRADDAFPVKGRLHTGVEKRFSEAGGGGCGWKAGSGVTGHRFMCDLLLRPESVRRGRRCPRPGPFI